MSWVPNLLIKQGARLLQDAEDLLSDLPDHLRQTLLGQITNPDTPPKQEIDMDLRFGPSAPLAKALVQAVNVNVGVKLDSLFESLEGYSPSEIVATLFELELVGMVRQLPGKQFARVW